MSINVNIGKPTRPLTSNKITKTLLTKGKKVNDDILVSSAALTSLTLSSGDWLYLKNSTSDLTITNNNLVYTNCNNNSSYGHTISSGYVYINNNAPVKLGSGSYATLGLENDSNYVKFVFKTNSSSYGYLKIGSTVYIQNGKWVKTPSTTPTDPPSTSYNGGGKGTIVYLSNWDVYVHFYYESSTYKIQNVSGYNSYSNPSPVTYSNSYGGIVHNYAIGPDNCKPGLITSAGTGYGDSGLPKCVYYTSNGSVWSGSPQLSI